MKSIVIIDDESVVVEGLRVVLDRRPDVVITDICMPGIGGLALNKAVIEGMTAGAVKG